MIFSFVQERQSSWHLSMLSIFYLRSVLQGWICFFCKFFQITTSVLLYSCFRLFKEAQCVVFHRCSSEIILKKRIPLVLKGGLEPPCPLRHMNLNHACLPFHHFSLGSKSNGGVDRVRTDDPHNAIVMLFQLSYNPIGSLMRLKKILLVNVF